MRIHMRSFDASELEMLVTDPREPKFTHFPVSHSMYGNAVDSVGPEG